MKLFLMLCTVLSLAVFANSYPTEVDSEDLNDLDIDLLLGGIIIDDAKIECLKEAISKIIDDNPDLKWWFDDIEKTVLKFVKEGKACLSGNDQMKCLQKLRLQAQLALRSLLKAVPKDKKGIFNTLKDNITKCLA